MAALRSLDSPGRISSLPRNSPTPAPTIVLSGGPSDGYPAAPTGVPPHTRLRMLGALPAARRVLLIGCADHRLAHDHKLTNPGAHWHGLDDRAELLLRAADGLDESTHISLDALDALDGLDSKARFDLIVLDDVIHRCADPRILFQALARLATPQATLVLGFTNQAQIGMLVRLIEGDLGTSAQGPVRPGTLQQLSASSLYKSLLDAGWMPTLKDHVLNEGCADALGQAALAMADALAVPHDTVKASLRMDRMVFEARRIFDAAPQGEAAARFSVVVPTTRPRQLDLNVEQSPGLKEVGARIVSCRGATGPGHALAHALPHCDADWILLCHQDVYLPAGFGHRLNAVLDAIPAEERRTSLIGFVGMSVNAKGDGYAASGFVIDRLERADFADLPRAVSIDELAIVVSRDTVHRIDPAMGWHLWGTELCLAAICEHKVFARMVRLPIFHNSVTDHRLPAAFYNSARRLLEKYPQFEPIPSLCARIDRQWLGQRPAAAA